MPVTDRREPAVYVSIEDASYAAPALELGRVGYVVSICDRGPHNRIVTLTSREQLHKIFGQPNYRRTSQAHYLADKFLQYSNQLLFCRVMPDDAYWANSIITYSTASTKIKKAGGVVDALFTFRPSGPNPNIVTCADVASYNAVSVGTWIFATGDTIANAAQVVSKSTTGGYFLYLDRNYDGSAPTTPPCAAYSCSPFIETSQSNVNSVSDFDTTSANVVWYFYAKGAGTYYNNIVIKGVRNVVMEKMYTDSDGNVLYPYLFFDIGIYCLNDDGTYTLLEGPWTVSLTRRTATGSIIKDLTSGNIMYIEDILNNESQFVGVESADGVDKLVATGAITEASATNARLQVMLLMTVTGATVSSAGNIASGGLTFEQGTDGTVNTGRTLPMYNSSNNLESDRDYLNGLVKQAYQGALTSVDGSIEQMPECVYPWYEPDYIITGGYPAAIQDGGRALAEYRQDCICLADTGSNVTSYTFDITARLNDVPWNTWTAALYVQYRKIFDMFTGKYI